jgi:hypothetical protein
MPKNRNVKGPRLRGAPEGKLSENTLEWFSTGWDWDAEAFGWEKREPVTETVWLELQQVWLEHRADVKEYNQRDHPDTGKTWAEEELDFPSYQAWVDHQEGKRRAEAERLGIPEERVLGWRFA